MKHTLSMLALTMLALLAMSCGEDEQPSPTYDELIAKWLLSFGDNAPDGQLIGAVREAGEMEPLTCQLAGVDTTCYNVDGACAAGFWPTICFSEQAELVGCLQGKAEDPRDIARVTQLEREGRPFAAKGDNETHRGKGSATFVCEVPN